MEVSVRELRNDTGRIVAAVGAGEQVTLTVHGEPVADIVPHHRRARWVPGPWLADQLTERAADRELLDDLDRVAGGRTDELP